MKHGWIFAGALIRVSFVFHPWLASSKEVHEIGAFHHYPIFRRDKVGGAMLTTRGRGL
jgi:hypothetical protein